MLMDTKTVQRAMAATGFYKGLIDGGYGPITRFAAREIAKSKINLYKPTWSDDRVRIAIEQMIMSPKFYTSAIDGLPGPATQVALEKWQDYITFDRRSPDPSAGVVGSTIWPTQAKMVEFYGKPGTNHTTIKPPYSVYYDGDKVSKIVINKKCADSALRILNAVKKAYGAAKIKELGLDRYGGSYNNRKMRNGTALSTHAMAAAWDWDPERNQLRQTRRSAQFAKPEYDAFIDAHEAEGWISLGRARDFDWMHFQAVRL